ncbi:MAG: hypothetical protein J6D08_11530 [Lachnospiraceae bacterium]|nr:hypothetical protein [Lachnospiraceae bacterium]
MKQRRFAYAKRLFLCAWTPWERLSAELTDVRRSEQKPRTFSYLITQTRAEESTAKAAQACNKRVKNVLN